MTTNVKRVLMLGIVTVFAAGQIGCGGIPIRIVEEQDKQQAVGSMDADDAIAGATASIRAGELEEARAFLARAKESASTDRQDMQVRSLESLVAGAEAMAAGDTAAARTHWAAIEDPGLRRQVQARARTYDINVPDAVVSAE